MLASEMPHEVQTITIGTINGGTAPNVIAGSVEMKGTARCLDDATAQGLPARMERVVAGVCAASNAKYEFEFLHGYPALVNDEAFTERAIASAGKMLGEVAAIHDFGAGDVLTIRDKKGNETTLPFTEAVVPTVDLKAGRLIVDPPQVLEDGGAHGGGGR